MEALWPLVVVLGPILLLLAIIWALARNRRSRADPARTEQATRDLRDELDRRPEE